MEIYHFYAKDDFKIITADIEAACEEDALERFKEILSESFEIWQKRK